jgi:hypothetical protein
VRRVARWVGGALLVLPLLAILAAGAALLWLRSPAGNEFVRVEVVARAQPRTGSLEIGGLETDVLSRLMVVDLRLRAADGRLLLSVARLEARYALGGLLGKRLVVDSIGAHGVALDVDSLGEITRAWGDPARPRKGGPYRGIGLDVSVRRAEVDGNVAIGALAAHALAASSAVELRGAVIAFRDAGAAAVLRGYPVAAVASGTWQPGVLFLERAEAWSGPFHGEIAGRMVDDVLDFRVEDLEAWPAWLRPRVPALDDAEGHGRFAASGTVRGTLARPEVALDIAAPVGALAVAAAVEPATRAWTLHVEPRALDVSAATRFPLWIDGSAEVAGTGWTWPAPLAAEGTLDLSARWAGRPVSAAGAVAVRDGAVTLDRAAVATKGVRAQVSGVADVLDREATAQVHAATVDLRAVGVKGVVGRVDLAGAATVDWSGTEPEIGWRGRVASPEVRAGPWTQAVIAVDAEATVVGRRATVARVSGTVGAGSARRWSWSGGTVDAELDSVGLRGEIALEADSRRFLRVRGAYASASREVALDVLDLSPVEGTAWSLAAPARATIEPGGVRDLDVRIGGDGLSIVAQGDLLRDGVSRATVGVDGLELSTLSRALVDALPGWQGRVDAQLGVEGPPHALRVQGAGHARGLLVPGKLHGADLDVVAETDEETVAAELTLAREETVLATATARVPLAVGWDVITLHRDGPLDVELAVPACNASRWSALLGRELPTFEGSAGARLSGTLAEPVLDAHASARIPGTEADPRWLRASVDLRIAGEEATLRGGVEERFQPRAMLAGSARVPLGRLVGAALGGGEIPDPLLADATIAVIPLQLPLAALRPWLGLPAGIDGAVNGAIAAELADGAATLRGGLEVAGARLGQVTFTELGLVIEPTGAAHRVSVDGRAEEASIDLDATVPRALDGPLDAWMAISQLPLAALDGVVPGVTETSGTISVVGKIGGTPRSPSPDLAVRIRDGVLRYALTSVRYEDLALLARIDGDRWVLESSRATSAAPALGDAAGTLRVEGEGRWRPEWIGRATLAMDGAWLSARNDRRLQATGNLAVQRSQAATTIRGRVAIDTALVRLPERVFAGGAGLQLDPDLSVIREGIALPPPPPARDPVPTWLDAQVAVDMGRNVFVDLDMPLRSDLGQVARSASTVRVRTRLDGALDVRAEGGDLAVAGTIEPLHGTVDALTKSFSIAPGGSVVFDGSAWRKPHLALGATLEVSPTQVVRLDVGGFAGAPTLKLSSDPSSEEALGEEDLLSLVMFGRKLGDTEAGESQALSELATKLAFQSLAGEADELAALSRVEVFEATDSGARLGFTLAKDLFVVSEYEAAPPDAKNPTPVVRLALEYRTPTKWYLELSAGMHTERPDGRFGAVRKWRF